MTQKDAAKELGVNPGTLSKWERGLAFPNVVEIDRIQRLYNIGYADINFLNITRFNRIR
jgi:transcriptional regulator with XRE-family HTH domain